MLYENYRDNLFAKNAQQEVEAMRRKASYTGAGITAAALLGNEVARLTLRSRKSITQFPQYVTYLIFFQHCSSSEYRTSPWSSSCQRRDPIVGLFFGTAFPAQHKT